MSQAQPEKIGLTVATIVGMNAMIGAGIFSIPAALACDVGPAGILSFAFVIGAVWCMAHSLARLASLYPQEGSFYVYTKQWGGHVMGLIAAGAYLVGLLIAMGLLSQVAGGYVNHALPVLSTMQWGAIVLGALILLNSIGVVMSEVGQIILICCTVFPIITTILICFYHGNPANLTPFMPFGVKNLFSATRIVIFSFFGFECAASLFAVVKDPKRNVPKALTYAIVVVGTLYLLFVASLIFALPLEKLCTTELLPTLLAKAFPGNPLLLYGVHAAILSATIGTLHSMIWSASALLLAYLKQFRYNGLKRLIERGSYGPRQAVFTLGACIFASFLLLRQPNLFFSLTALCIIFAFVSSMITLLVLHTKKLWNKETIILIVGLLTAGVIMTFSLEGIIETIR